MAVGAEGRRLSCWDYSVVGLACDLSLVSRTAGVFHVRLCCWAGDSRDRFFWALRCGDMP